MQRSCQHSRMIPSPAAVLAVVVILGISWPNRTTVVGAPPQHPMELLALDTALVAPVEQWLDAEADLLSSMGPDWQKGFDGIKLLFSDFQEHRHRIAEGAENGLVCLGCKSGVSLILVWITAGATEDQITVAIANLCTVLNLYNRETCYGVVSRYMPEIYFIAKHKQLTPDVVCAVLLQMYGCGLLNPSEAEWDIGVDIGKPPEEDIIESGVDGVGVTPVKIIQFADLHYDPEYLPGSSSTCSYPICCRESTGSAAKPEDRAGFWGEYAKCDMPYHSLANAFAHARDHHSDAAMVVMTGDLPDHALWATTRKNSLAILFNMSDSLREHFPNIPVYPILGNHEPHPANSYPYNNVPDDRFQPSWIYEAAATAWSSWLPSDALDSVRKRGFYSVSPFPGLRVLGLNTNMCYTLNFWLLYDWRDPEGHLKWLAEELLKAEKSKEAVMLLGHVPPGNEDCWGEWSRHFEGLVHRFRNIIGTQLYSHTHADEFKLCFQGTKASGVLFLGSSLTTFQNLNPSYKVLHLHPTSWRVLDYETWTYNLTEANLNGVPKWYRLYSAKQSFGLSSLLPSQFDQLVHKMVTNDSLFQEYQRVFWRDSEPGLQPACDDRCKATQLCRLVTCNWRDQKHCRSIRSRTSASPFQP